MSRRPAPKKKAAAATTKKAAPTKNKAAPTRSKQSAPTKKKGAPTRSKQAAPTKNKAAPTRNKQAAPTRRKKTAVPQSSGRVHDIISDDDPIAALRWFLDSVPGTVSAKSSQIALGAAQLMLLPIPREARGGPEVRDLLDLILTAWPRFSDRTGFHAQEFLRNAFAAVGADPDRIAKLLALVPDDPPPELLFNIARTYAVAGDREAMLLAVKAAIASGASATSFRNDDDFAAYADDTELGDILDGARAPQIPVDVARHVRPVRAALDRLRGTLDNYGEPYEVGEPASLDAVLAAERAARIQLPNDFRALLTLADGCRLFGRTFFSLADFRSDTALAQSARAYLIESAQSGRPGINDCVPLANWGRSTDWLLYDPYGYLGAGRPGYVIMLDADDRAYDGLVAVLDRITALATDDLATN